jgi:anti-sigma factor RsiW
MGRHVNDHELMLSLDGELSPRRQSQVAQHVETCHVCRERSDTIRSAMAEAEACHRADHAAPPRSMDYGRMRLAFALREADVSEPAWFERMSLGVGRLQLAHGLKLGLVMTAVCAVAFIAVRATTESAAGGARSGALPEPALTPGAVTQLTTAELCNGVRPSRIVTEDVRQQVLRAYGMERVSSAAYELDALVTPELGGSTDPANLWPQRYHSPVWNARVKDELERLLPEMVCRQEMTLAQAQREIAADWIAAYKRYFKTDMPLRAHLGPAEDEEPELLFVQARSAL